MESVGQLILRPRFMLEMMDHPSMIRNVAVAGHLHHGKTSLLDSLVLETHQLTWDADAPVSLLEAPAWGAS